MAPLRTVGTELSYRHGRSVEVKIASSVTLHWIEHPVEMATDLT
jgi:hypothetical protein